MDAGVGPDAEPCDATLKATIRGGVDTGVFLLVSNPDAPDLVARNAALARSAADALPPSLRAAVLLPLGSGRVHGISWAVYPLLHTLRAQGLPWRFQRMLLGSAVCRWLNGVASATAAPVSATDLESRVRSPLEELAADPEFPAEIRAWVPSALTALDQGAWQPRAILAHNDLWHGNVLRVPGSSPDSGTPPRFRVTDWAGSRLAGVPCFDLVRTFASFRIPAPVCRHLLRRHCRVLRAGEREACHYLLLALARLRGDLDRFPYDRFVGMAAEAWELVQRVSGAPGPQSTGER
jgi:hypothetical protein